MTKVAWFLITFLHLCFNWFQAFMLDRTNYVTERIHYKYSTSIVTPKLHFLITVQKGKNKKTKNNTIFFKSSRCSHYLFFFLSVLVLVISNFVGLVIHTRNDLSPQKERRGGRGKYLNVTIITFINVFF